MTVTTRRTRREQDRRRQQRKRGGGGGSSPRRISQLWVIAGVAVAVIALFAVGRVAGVFESPPPPVNVNSTEFDTAGQTIGAKMADLGNAHIPQGQKAQYSSVPPTSGEHWLTPAPWGIKDAVLPNEVTTHNLEHGGIVMVYNDLSADEVGKLKSLTRQLNASGFPKIILEPYPELKDAKVAVTSWDWILKLPSADQAQIIKFVRAHYDGKDAPEAGAQ